MAVTAIGKPGDYATTFSLQNRSTQDVVQYGVTADGKIYRNRRNHDALTPFAGGNGTYVDTGLTIPDIATPNDL